MLLQAQYLSHTERRKKMNTKSKKKWKRRRILCWFWPWSSDDLGLPTGRWLPAIGVNMAAPGISLDLRTTKSKGIVSVPAKLGPSGRIRREEAGLHLLRQLVRPPPPASTSLLLVCPWLLCPPGQFGWLVAGLSFMPLL
jgi:hypothetical protein